MNQLCRHCPLEFACKKNLKKEKKIVVTHRNVIKRETIYSKNDYSNYWYVLRTGSAMLVQPEVNSEPVIINFLFPGTLFGTDGINTLSHKHSAIALEHSYICLLRKDSIINMALDSTQHINKLLNTLYESTFRKPLQHLNALQKISIFLLDLSLAHKKQGMSPHHLFLSMKRQYIANYLGLTIETVSRNLTLLQKDKVIHIDLRTIKILKIKQLHILMGEHCVTS